MIEMADRLAPEGEDAAVISHIKGVTDSRDVWQYQCTRMQSWCLSRQGRYP